MESFEDGYKKMAADEDREREAMEWAEAAIADVSDETPLRVI